MLGFKTFRNARVVVGGLITIAENPANPDLQTFNPMFPKGNYFGQLVSIRPLNHRDLHPTVELSLPHDITVVLD
jgi:hypothetical protein